MGRCYDNWERLVEAVMRREQIRSLCLADSRSPSIRSTDSDFSSLSSSSRFENLSSITTPSPLQADLLKLKLAQAVKGRELKVPAKIRNSMWKGLSIFSGFSPKKKYVIELNELNVLAEMARRRAETARLREVHTLKGHIESLMKSKGLDIDSINSNYTI